MSLNLRLDRAPSVGGRRFLEPCLLVREAGEGGMAAVYQAYDVGRRCWVAVKIAKDPRDYRRAFTEAFTGQREFGEHVVRVHEVRRIEEVPYLVMEWVDGGSLDAVAERGPLGDGRVLAVGRQAAAGLERVHAAGMIHRDLKPSNLLVTRDGTVKLADFGIVKSAESVHTRTFNAPGSRLFMAPEIEEGAEPTPAADVYALGVTLYLLAAGISGHEARPQLARILRGEADPLPELAPGFHAGLAACIERCMAHDPSLRPADAAELAAELGTLDLTSASLAGLVAPIELAAPDEATVRAARELMASPQLPADPPADVRPPEPPPVEPAPSPGALRTAAPWLAGAAAAALIGLQFFVGPDREVPPDIEPQTAAQVEQDSPEARLEPSEQPAGPSPAAGADIDPSRGAVNDANDGQIEAERPEPIDAQVALGVATEGEDPDSAPAAEPDAPVAAAEAERVETPEVLEPAPDAAEPEIAAAPADPSMPRGLVAAEFPEAARFPLFRPTGLGLAPETERFLTFARIGDDFVGCFEVCRLLAFDLGLIEEPVEPVRAWTPATAEQRTALVDALNARLGPEAGFRFVQPTVERWDAMAKRVNVAAPLRRVAFSQPRVRQETRTGEFDDAPRAPTPRPPALRVDDFDQLWHPAGLYGVLGGIRETCLQGPDEGPLFLGCCELDRMRKDLDAASLLAPAHRSASPLPDWDGLRLFLDLVDP